MFGFRNSGLVVQGFRSSGFRVLGLGFSDSGFGVCEPKGSGV